MHSNEAGMEYGDSTGHMGYSFRGDNLGQRCFNGDKSWQLGWYVGGYHSPSLAAGAPLSFTLIPTSKFDLESTGTTSKFVVIQVANSFYLMFNEASSFNSQTGEAVNEVTVVQGGTGPPSSLSFQSSTLVKSLAQGETWTAQSETAAVTILISEINTQEHFAAIELTAGPPLAPGPAQQCGTESGCCDQVSVPLDFGALTMVREDKSCCQNACTWTAAISTETLVLAFWPAFQAYLVTSDVSYSSCNYSGGDISYYPPMLPVEVVQASCAQPQNKEIGAANSTRGRPGLWHAATLTFTLLFFWFYLLLL